MRLGVKEDAKEKGISKGKLQLDAGVAYNTGKRMFKDSDGIATTEMLGKLARAFGVSPVTLLDKVSDEPRRDSSK